MFNLHLGLTMIFYAAFPYTGFTVHKYFTLPYIKPLIMTPYLPQGDIRLALSFFIKFLFFLLVSHLVIRFSKIGNLINKNAPISLVIIFSSLIIAFVSVYYSMFSPGNFRSFVTQIFQTVIIFSLIRLYVLNKENESIKNI